MAVVPSAFAAGSNSSSEALALSNLSDPNSVYAAHQQQHRAWLQATTQWQPLMQHGGAHHPHPPSVWQAPSATCWHAPRHAQPAYSWDVFAPRAQTHPADDVQVTFLREVFHPDTVSVQVLVQSRGVQQKAWGTAPSGVLGGIGPAIQAAGHIAVTAAVENIGYLYSATNAKAANHVADPSQMTGQCEFHGREDELVLSRAGKHNSAATEHPAAVLSSAVRRSPITVSRTETVQARQEFSYDASAVEDDHRPTEACIPSSERSRLTEVRRRKTGPAAAKSMESLMATTKSLQLEKSSNSATQLGAGGVSFESRQKLKILAVDDEPLNIKMLHRSLTRQGHDVTIGEDGQDVIEQCISLGKTFDVILLDENMRHMNGTVAAGKLRKHEDESGIPKTTIIMTTANVGPHDVAKYHSIGVDGIVSKPMDMRALGSSLLHFKAFGSTVNAGKSASAADDSPAKASSKAAPRFTADESLKFGELEIFTETRPEVSASSYATRVTNP